MKKLTRLNNLLPFVAIGTVADCQSILEPINRRLVQSGLSILQNYQTYPLGLKELIIQTGLQEKISSYHRITSQDLGYILSPILNSSGRISHAKLSIKTLLATKKEAGVLAKKLIQTNQNRKDLVKDILTEIEAQAKAQFEDKESVIWLEGDWNKGVIGLIASRLVNKYNLPVIVVENGKVSSTASLRAPEGYHIPMAMKTCKVGLLEKYGGHPCAAGFTCQSSNLKKVKNALKKQLAKQSLNLRMSEDTYLSSYKLEDLPENLKILIYQKNMLWLPEEEIDSSFLEQILKLDPFGQDFPFPLLVFKILKPNLRWLKGEFKHFKITLRECDLTSFNVDNKISKKINSAKEIPAIWVVAKVSQNTWNGKTKLELVAENIYCD